MGCRRSSDHYCINPAIVQYFLPISSRRNQRKALTHKAQTILVAVGGHDNLAPRQFAENTNIINSPVSASNHSHVYEVHVTLTPPYMLLGYFPTCSRKRQK